jgi:prepilin peptidase CpaA
MEQLSAAAFALSLLGGVHDLLSKKIPNWLTLPGMVLGIAAQAWFFGGAGALNGALGLLLGFALFFPMYALGYMGAGDVKLLMAVGAWLGWGSCLWVAAVAVSFGGVYALGEVLWKGRLLAVARNTYQFLRTLLLPWQVAEPLKMDHERKFAFGICISLAVAALIYLRNSGRLP